MSIEALFNERDIFASELSVLEETINSQIISIIEVAISNGTINTLLGDDDYWMENSDHPNTCPDIIDEGDYHDGEQKIAIECTVFDEGIVTTTLRFTDAYDDFTVYTFDIESELMGADSAVIKSVLETREIEVVTQYEEAHEIIKAEEQREAMEERKKQKSALDEAKLFGGRYGGYEATNRTSEMLKKAIWEMSKDGDSSSESDYAEMVLNMLQKDMWESERKRDVYYETCDSDGVITRRYEDDDYCYGGSDWK